MHTLKKNRNDLSFLTVPMPGAKTVTVLVLIGTGAKYEDKRESGVSHFLEHLFFKGTKKYPNPMALSSAIDAIGGESNAFTSKEFTGYYMKVASAKAETALAMVAEMLLNSKFDAAEMAKERGVIIEEINMYEDNPMMSIEDVLEECLYGDTPAGRETSGSKETVSALTREDIVRYFSAQYQPHNTIVCLAGNFSKSFAAKAEKTFEAFASKHQEKNFKEKAAVAVSQKAPQLKIKFKQTDQAHFSLGVHALPHGHPDETILKVMAVILGGSMSSRLFNEIREKRGLAYYVRTSAESYTDCGYLTTQGGVRVEAMKEVIKVTLAEYAKMAKTPVPAKELARVKDLIKGRIPLALESSDDLGEWYARQAVMKLTQERTGQVSRAKLYSPEEFFKKIDAVTAADIKRVAKSVFVADKLNLAIIGPYKNEAEFKKLLKF
ncbi:insulinase family protein [Candidatus Falkowbacteria bacterium]|nr:insulinase family protein [Candidatus Falkowbacteria bacterium]